MAPLDSTRECSEEPWLAIFSPAIFPCGSIRNKLGRTVENLYTEAREAGYGHRARYLEQVQALIKARQASAADLRRANFTPHLSSPAAYASSVAGYRAEFRAMLGFPLAEAPEVPAIPAARLEKVAEDDLGQIFRVHIEAMPGYEVYGLLFLPPAAGPHRLVVSQHGGGGTPELVAEFFEASNYNNMTRRILRRGYAVFSPQTLLWGEAHGPALDRHLIDRSLKQLGGSVAALELFGMGRALDYLLARPDLLPDGAGMTGLSYGGFYTLFLAALDTRILAALSSCFVSDRLTYNWADWVWDDAGHRFLDAEIGSLVCPRALYIEVGDKDELFDGELARPVLDEIAARYAALGLADHFVGCVFDGTHEFATTDEGLDFLDRHLKRP